MNRAIASESRLPALLIPCAQCGGRMAIRLIKPAMFADDVEDIIHRCDGCGAELTRSVKRLSHGKSRAVTRSHPPAQ
jgi:hypothetical protein